MSVQIWIRDHPSRPREKPMLLSLLDRIARNDACTRLACKRLLRRHLDERQTAARKSSPCRHGEVLINMQRYAFATSAN